MIIDDYKNKMKSATGIRKNLVLWCISSIRGGFFLGGGVG